MAQGVFSKYITKGVLEDLTTAVSWNEQGGSPYLQLPSADVRVGSTLPDGTPGIASLLFGGSSPVSTSKKFTWETQSETKFYAPGSPQHRVKVNADIRYDANSAVPNTNSDGSYSYNSLSDLAANTPVSFTRSLNDPTQSGGEWNGYASISDWFRVSPALPTVVRYAARRKRVQRTARLQSRCQHRVRCSHGLRSEYRGPESTSRFQIGSTRRSRMAHRQRWV